MKERVMPLGLVVYLISKKFRKFNPTIEPNNLDWSILNGEFTFSENYDLMKKRHPEYKWDYEKSAWRNEEWSRWWHKKWGEDRTKKDWLPIPAGDEVVYKRTIWIKPHTSRSKGKKYTYGRIQLSVVPDWVGFRATIFVSKL